MRTVDASPRLQLTIQGVTSPQEFWNSTCFFCIFSPLGTCVDLGKGAVEVHLRFHFQAANMLQICLPLSVIASQGLITPVKIWW